MIDFYEKNHYFYQPYIGLTLFTTVFLQKSLNYIDFDRGSGKQKSILTGGPGRNAKHFLTRGPSRTNPPPNPTDPAHVWLEPFIFQ